MIVIVIVIFIVGVDFTVIVIVTQADSDRHRHLVQDTGDAANGSGQTDGSASKGHQANEQGIGASIIISIGIDKGIGISIRNGIKSMLVLVQLQKDLKHMISAEKMGCI